MGNVKVSQSTRVNVRCGGGGGGGGGGFDLSGEELMYLFFALGAAAVVWFILQHIVVILLTVAVLAACATTLLVLWRRRRPEPREPQAPRSMWQQAQPLYRPTGPSSLPPAPRPQEIQQPATRELHIHLHGASEEDAATLARALDSYRR